MIENSYRHVDVRVTAMATASRDEVDRLASVASEAGARRMSGPRACPEYSPTCYAAFFDDPCGNALEICHIAT